MGLGGVPIQLNCSADQLDRNFVIADLMSDQSEKMQSINVIGIGLKDLPVSLFGGLQTTALMMLDGGCQGFGNRRHFSVPKSWLLRKIDADDFFVVANVHVPVGICWSTPDHLAPHGVVRGIDDVHPRQFGKSCRRNLTDDQIASFRKHPELVGFIRSDQERRPAIQSAITCFRRALKLKPSDAVAHSNLGTALKDQGLLDEAVACFRRALELKPDYTIAHSNLLLTLQYCDGVTLPELAAAHAEFERRHAAPLHRTIVRAANIQNRRDRPRLGFVSADFGRHPVGFFLVRVLENLFQEKYEMFCYSDRNVKDDLTHRMQSVSMNWHDVLGMSDTRVAELIRSDEIDILFDLAGHTGHNRMLVFARKPAPIQMTWIGYEGTTGLSAMDYLIADQNMIPKESEVHYRERVLRMPDGYLCYEPPDSAPSVSPPPSLTNGYVTFGSFNNLAKITPHVVKVWSEILRRSPSTKLIMKYGGLGDPLVKQRYLDAFVAHGVDSQRLTLLPPSSYAEYLASYCEVDFMLDPFPFSGSTTTCEALWMGVPVITCPFETFASRHSFSHLSNIGATETIAQSLDEYVELAVSLSGDLSQMAAIRTRLRQRMQSSPLCDGHRFAANLGAMLQSTWESHVN